jgi:hypothetical protein
MAKNNNKKTGIYWWDKRDEFDRKIWDWRIVLLSGLVFIGISIYSHEGLIETLSKLILIYGSIWFYKDLIVKEVQSIIDLSRNRKQSIEAILERFEKLSEQQRNEVFRLIDLHRPPFEADFKSILEEAKKLEKD